MRYINRELKGTFGYIRKQTVFEVIKTVILFAMALGISFIGLATLGTRKSLWSVFAVLALLPASKSLVGVIMLARFRSLSAEKYEKYSNIAGIVPALYENILTTGERTFYVPMICYMAQSLIAYLPGSSADCNELRRHFDNVFKTAGYEKITVKVFENEDSFLERVQQMSEKTGDEPPSYPSVFNTIKAVSL